MSKEEKVMGGKLSDEELNKVTGGKRPIYEVCCTKTGGVIDQEAFSGYYNVQYNDCLYYETILPFTPKYKACEECKFLAPR